MDSQDVRSPGLSPALLSVGVDSLYWSSRVELTTGLGELEATKAKAIATGDAVPLPWVEGFSLSVLPHGAFRYPFVVDCHELRVHLTESRRLPTVWVQLRSAFIHEVGVTEAIAASVKVAEGLVGVSIGEPHASRVDLYADFADWRLVHGDRVGLITRADVRAHFRVGTDEVETIQVGKSPFLVRLYRKDIEVRERGGHAPVFWSGWSGAVLRVELQVGSERLRAFGIGTVAEALASLGDLWRYGTSEFLELRVPASGPREGWQVREEWRAVQSVGYTSFPRSGVVPYVVVRGDRLRLLRALFGYLTSLGAIEGERRLLGLLRELPKHLAVVARGRPFEDEVDRKTLRLPRAVRESPLDFDAASASPGKEAPWAPEPSQTDTRTDA